MACILGDREFCGLPDRGARRPRWSRGQIAETRGRGGGGTVVKAMAARRGPCRILDLGTGTGAIALALLSAVPAATATGVDISAGALATAAYNAGQFGLGGRFTTVQSDWFEKFPADTM